MKRAVPLSQFMPYGAPDLIAAGPSNLSRAVITSSALAVAAFFLLVVTVPLIPKAVERAIELPPDVIDLLNPMLPPPVVERTPPQSTPVTRGEPDVGDLVPVPDRPEIVEPVAPAGPAKADGDRPAHGEGPAVAPGRLYVPDEPIPGRNDVVFTDELPVAVREVKPDYPAFGREAGVEGLVIVHVLVGKEGRVIKAEVNEKVSIPLLNEAALEAARRWVFKPALANNHPVPVWVALRFRFRLNE
jgi:protein TonB